jgi:hypothetical protein
MEQRHNVSAEGKFHAPEHSLVQGPADFNFVRRSGSEQFGSDLHVPPTEGGLLAFFLGLDLLLLLGGRLLFGRGLKLRRLCCFRL